MEISLVYFDLSLPFFFNLLKFVLIYLTVLEFFLKHFLKILLVFQCELFLLFFKILLKFLNSIIVFLSHILQNLLFRYKFCIVYLDFLLQLSNLFLQVIDVLLLVKVFL